MAGDMGVMLDISREYPTGVVLGVFWSFTDTSEVPLSFNRNYNQKGVYLRLPVRMFLQHDSPEVYNYTISPWTRDVGATVFHWQDLFSIAGDLMPARFKAKIDELKE